VWTAVGVHLQADARRADPKLIESDYLGDVARAIFERSAGRPRCRWSAGSAIAQAKSLARRAARVRHQRQSRPAGRRARYDLPPVQIQRLRR
jgi:hypothetical protein